VTTVNKLASYAIVVVPKITRRLISFIAHQMSKVTLLLDTMCSTGNPHIVPTVIPR